MIATLGEALRIMLFVVVLVGALPLVAALIQFLLVGIHGLRNHYDAVADFTPRTAVVVPAWNEAAVIGATIDRLVSLDYPRDALRVYVVDDASTDATPDVVQEKILAFPDVVVHVRRDKGGEGKAHTLNAGLERILADDWAEAILIIDADVIFQRDALRRMSRHLADPGVGAVTAYIKEGSTPSGWMTRFIAFEYITAQAAARRAQNVLGAMMCLAGGAQLHSRANLEAIGGRIDTATLAEDTVTTFRTQRRGRLALFEGNAIVWAEEPNDISGLWKQRLRWARGNVQITRRYRSLWFRRRREPLLGQFGFGVLWFVTLGMPAFMIAGSISLVVLFFIDFGVERRSVPRAVDHERDRVRLHHPVLLRDRPADRPARVVAGSYVPRSRLARDHGLHVRPRAVHGGRPLPAGVDRRQPRHDVRARADPLRLRLARRLDGGRLARQGARAWVDCACSARP